MSVWFCLPQKGGRERWGWGGGGALGGWRGSREERDNKAGGDVNSQIGSFSCFPPPATLDGWLRQIPSASGRRSPSGGPGMEGVGSLEPRWGLWGGYSRGCKGRNGPGKLATPGDTEGELHQLFTCLPCLQPPAPEVVRADVPSGYTRAKRLSTRGVRDARAEVGRRLRLRILLFLFPPLFSRVCSHPLPLPSLLVAPSSLLSLCLSSHCFSPAPSPPLLVTSAAGIGSAWLHVSCGHSRNKSSASRFLSLPFRVLGELRVPLRSQT